MVNVVVALFLSGQVNPPDRVLSQITDLTISYWSFDKKTESGLLQVHCKVASEVREIFEELHRARFPIHSIRPMAEFGWSDDESMESNNTSGFCWRTIKGSKKLSDHAFGLAIDINPRLNPHVDARGIPLSPGSYQKRTPGTIFASGPVVRAFERRGWQWGGRWKSSKDFMHFSRRIY
ncbi:MAG: hypothetical protein HONBIEJF_02359 [Fimbriimonadaceae bacterium]|nr:hypothetical protein [Fimbriimonadaceae bacterium]